MSTAGASILAVGYLLPLVYLTLSLWLAPMAGNNPWDATGLEWQTPSPPPTDNFDEMPVVTEPPYAYPESELAAAPQGAHIMTTIEHEHASEHGHGHLAHHFEDLGQQHESANLGMWTFLATEVMFFGGLFAGFAVYRFNDPTAFATACRQLDICARHDQHRGPADQQPDDGPGRPRRPGGAREAPGPLPAADHAPGDDLPHDQGDRVLLRIQGTPCPRPVLQHRGAPCPGGVHAPGHQADGALLRLLLLHDGAARLPHGHRHRPDDLDGDPARVAARSHARITRRWS